MAQGREEERQSVLRMLAEGKITSAQANDLLKALGGPAPAGDSLPISPGTIITLLGGLVIVVGFMLPWVSVRLEGFMGSSMMRGNAYQAGHHVGFLGWLILSLGLAPAILAAIPALDKALRQGLLRLILSATGIAFAVSVMMNAGGNMRIGIVLVFVGFVAQLLSAIGDSGLLRTRPVPDVAA